MILRFFMLFSLLVVSVSTELHAQNTIHPDKKNIFILHSYNKGNRWTDDITRGILSVFDPYGFEYNLYIEHMDTKRVTQDMDTYFESLSDYLQNKYAHTKIDLIILSDNNALDFIKKNRSTLFADSPIVFSGINNFTTEMVSGLEPVTGVVEHADIKTNVKLIQTLNPALQKLFIINDQTTTGYKINEQVEEILKSHFPKLEYEFVNHMSLEGMVNYMQVSKENSAVLFILFFQDYKRNTYNYNEAVDYLSHQIDIPMFGLWDFYLGNGIVGGSLASGYAQGVHAADMGLKILKGLPISQVPILHESPNRYLFDYTQLKRFNIKTDLLPKDSEVINRPLTFSDIYKKNTATFWLIGSVVILLIAVILFLTQNLRSRKKTQDMLTKSNDALEELVDERTKELERTNQALNENVQHLVETVQELERKEERLVESEKMASLGELVAGMTHEVNTPLGISTTAISHLNEGYKNIRTVFDNNQMKKSSLVHFLNTCEQTIQIITTNITRASDLIRSFKSVAVDQCSESVREFNMHEYLDEITLSLRPKLKNTKHKVKIECEPGLKVENYPGAFSQIITNLVMNSLLHGFEDISEGVIKISCKPVESTIKITYSDNGKGMDAETQSKIFERYFTTKKGKGGSGLGLYIIKNIVEKDMKGTIECMSKPGMGTTFSISIPTHVSQPTSNQ